MAQRTEASRRNAKQHEQDTATSEALLEAKRAHLLDQYPQVRLARQVVSERGLLPLELVSSVTGENVDEALNRLVIAIQCRRMQQQREQQQQATGARVRRRGRDEHWSQRRGPFALPAPP